jgi:hypothetical protein
MLSKSSFRIVIPLLLMVSVAAGAADLDRIPLTIKQPKRDVPASCAGFVGGWKGNWSGYGTTWLWVIEVDTNCVAKYAHRSTEAFPATFKTAEIRGGVLVAPDAQGNIDSFELHDDQIWGRHSESGRTNSAVFRIVHKPTPKPPPLPESEQVACAAFKGAWVGDWGFGRRMLWVRDVDETCVAQYSYGPPRTSPVVSIQVTKAGLAFPCEPSVDMCSFTAQNEELKAQFGGTGGFTFKKVPTPVIGQ